MTSVISTSPAACLAAPLPIGRGSSFRLRSGERFHWTADETAGLLHVGTARNTVRVACPGLALEFLDRLNAGETLAMAEVIEKLGGGGEEATSIALFRRLSRLAAMELVPPARDLVDANRVYAAQKSDLAEWEGMVADFFEEMVFKLPVPAGGFVVELGTYRARNFDRLCRRFGPTRCIGYDVCNYANHPRVTERDVRDLSQGDDVPVALGWNDISGWAASPQSKAAGFLFLTRNVLPGGYYLDAALVDDPFESYGVTGFSLVAEWKWMKVFRRS